MSWDFKRRCRFVFTILTVLFCFTGIAKSDQEKKFEISIDLFAHEFAIPVYEKLHTASNRVVLSVEYLCKQSNSNALNNAQDAFKALVQSWSHAEVIRFGPVRDQNRFEKIFFWPDPRSRGLKQVQKKLHFLEKNSTFEKLNFDGMSVAIQGLPALEFLLFGEGSEVLISKKSSLARCQYALGISKNLTALSKDILADWISADGFIKSLQNTGENNPVFRNKAEVIQNILKSASEILQLAISSKLQSSLQKSMLKAKPKRAPFWRSNLVIMNMRGNLDAVVHLHSIMQLSTLLPTHEQGIVRELTFEAKQANAALVALEQNPTSWTNLLTQKENYELLEYVKFPLGSVERALSVYYPEALGLKLGFNSLDGD